MVRWLRKAHFYCYLLYLWLHHCWQLSLCAFIATFKTSTSKTSDPTISALVNRLHCEENSFRWAGDPETTLGWLHCPLTYEGFKKLWRVLDFSMALAESQPMQKEELFHLSKGMLIIYWLLFSQNGKTICKKNCGKELIKIYKISIMIQQ